MNSQEIALERARAEARASWGHAGKLVSSLLAGHPPLTFTVWGVLLRPGESLLLDTHAQYSRLYGGDGTYTHVNGFYYGSLGFVALGYSLTALGNTMRRNAAAAHAAVRWRDHEEVRLLVTDQRLLCLVHGQWLTFDYSTATAFYPEPTAMSLAFEFPSTSPLRLVGPTMPLVAVLAVWSIHGLDGIAQHPALHVFRNRR